MVSKVNCRNRRYARRRGLAIVYVALGLTIFIGAAALGVDLGYLHYRRAEAQKTADAAALAGAQRMSNLEEAEKQAAYYAALNGYDNGTGPNYTNTTSTTAPVYIYGRPDPAQPTSQYTVSVKQREPLFFAYILGFANRYVGASATAEILAPVPVEIFGDGTYGTATGKMNLAVFGPYGLYEHGDAYSTRFLHNGVTPNPDYQQDGYAFAINIPADYQARNGTSQVAIDIFDPDTYNAGNVSSPQHGTRIDEYHNGVQGRNTSTPTVTQYTLSKPNGEVLATATYGADTTTDMKWVSPTGFTFDLNDLGGSGAQSLRINVKTLEGSNENGFSLRAGPPGAIDGNPSDAGGFNPANGTSITATGRLPFNFNESGNVSIKLGTVPSRAAGGTLSIKKFDTDVGSQFINYSTTSLPNAWQGVLTGNGEWNTDTLDIPDNYTAGEWIATYGAGLQDTSVWELTYSGSTQGAPGSVRLVK